MENDDENNDIIYSTNAVGKRLYICKKCYKRYSTQKNFDNHLTSCKEVNEELKCTKCYTLFSSVKSKLRHDRTCIKEEDKEEDKEEESDNIIQKEINRVNIDYFNEIVENDLKTITDEEKNKIISDALKYKCSKDSKTLFINCVLQQIKNSDINTNNICAFLEKIINNYEEPDDENNFLIYFNNIAKVLVK